jgi:opacity protein-like surface antigen
LRAEVEFAFRNNSAENWNLTGANTLPNNGDADFYSIMFNSILDLGTYKSWTPYIGGGIGIGFIDYNGIALVGPANVSIQDEVFSYQGIVGLSRSINSRISLFSEYRYFGFNSADVEVGGIPSAGVTSGSTDAENVLFGLRMSF